MRCLALSIAFVAIAGQAVADLASTRRGNDSEQSCTYTLSPLTFTVSGAGGTGVVNVTTSAGCSWTASTQTPWLSLQSSGGVGSGAVMWSASANILSTQRIGLLTIADRMIVVAQLQPTASTTAPGAPRQLVATAIGSAVSLTWSAPDAGGLPTTYILSVGSASGWSNVATFPTGATQTSFSATNVPNGVYFVRVNAQNAAGTSPPSNEVSVTVSQGCGIGVSAPSALQSSVNGAVVTLTWWASSGGAAMSYVIEVGTGPLLANLGSFNTGSPATWMTATAVPGTYYVRVRALTPCGVSPPSQDVVIGVGGD